MTPVSQEKVPLKRLVAKCRGEQVLEFTFDGTHPVEDGIMDSAYFNQLLVLLICSNFFKKKVKVNGKPGNPGGGVIIIERRKSRITITSEVPFPKRFTTNQLCNLGTMCALSVS
ncbi:unnamed protein product [Nyctereutes procyonoides]|uniref:Large ribosomal subunit protein eL22 n=1 Tax=Nyctereutes procyonoides TaxID=34880 RepID=A0A811Y0R0_NYCPR|nr:unnamed protein product [Nyctereutes procyonoides]